MAIAKRVIQTLLWLSLGCAAAASGTGERVLFNGKIFTADAEHPYAEAVAIRGDKIVAVGSRGEVSKSVGKDAEAIDLKGDFLLPGLIDSHCHAVEGGLALLSAEVNEAIASVDDLAAFVADSKRTGRGMQGGILTIRGIPLAFWSKINDLNSRFSAAPYADQGVLLLGMDGHTAWANRALLNRAGINGKLISGLDAVNRGYYGFDQTLAPNGFLVDAGVDKVNSVIPEPSEERMRDAGRAAVQHLHELGITAWLDPLATPAILHTYRQLSADGELNSHVVALPLIDFKKGHADQQLAEALKFRDDFKDVHDVRVAGIKVFADGVLEYPSQTAVLSKPYHPSGRNGELLFDPAQFARIAIQADKQGMIVHVHAIGDQAVTEALNGIEAARKANGSAGLPHTITHLQLIRTEDIPRFCELGVIASMQLYWAVAETDTIDLVKPYIDPTLYEQQYPARSLLNAGTVIAGASDWPVSTANVFQAIYRAETRKGEKGVLNPDQRMPREAMIYAYTRNAARALGEEDKIGSIVPGKQADFTVVDRDILTGTAEEARDTKVLWTIVGGKTVYGAKP